MSFQNYSQQWQSILFQNVLNLHPSGVVVKECLCTNRLQHQLIRSTNLSGCATPKALEELERQQNTWVLVFQIGEEEEEVGEVEEEAVEEEEEEEVKRGPPPQLAKISAEPGE